MTELELLQQLSDEISNEMDKLKSSMEELKKIHAEIEKMTEEDRQMVFEHLSNLDSERLAELLFSDED